tara:strand:+ start:6780 stop:7277 length:498 start_codon:yes stop_codon:yes gene_type:complete
MVKNFNHTFIEQHNETTQLALQTPIVNFRDGFGCTGQNGRHIDKDSFLKYNSLQTQTGEKRTLPHVGFLTVPYMGCGQAALKTEPRLDSEYTYAPKSSKKSGVRNRFIPLVGCIANEIQQPEHILPEAVRDDWLRGGYPSRKCKYDRAPTPCPINSTHWPFPNQS